MQFRSHLVAWMTKFICDPPLACSLSKTCILPLCCVHPTSHPLLTPQGYSGQRSKTVGRQWAEPSPEWGRQVEGMEKGREGGGEKGC